MLFKIEVINQNIYEKNNKKIVNNNFDEQFVGFPFKTILNELSNFLAYFIKTNE